MTYKEKIALSGDPTTPRQQLVELGKDEDWAVRYVVVTNISCPSEVIELLFNDEVATIRYIAISRYHNQWKQYL